MKKEKENIGLCFRCEHRARYLETNQRPRLECSLTDKSVYSCYMYRPVKPVILEKNKNDRRYQLAPMMMSARSHVYRLPKDGDEIILIATKIKRKLFLFWQSMEK